MKGIELVEQWEIFIGMQPFWVYSWKPHALQFGLLCLQLCLRACLLAIGAFLLTLGTFSLTMGASVLTIGAFCFSRKMCLRA